MVEMNVYDDNLREDFNKSIYPDNISDFKPEIQDLIRHVWKCGGRVIYRACNRWETYRAITGE